MPLDLRRYLPPKELGGGPFKKSVQGRFMPLSTKTMGGVLDQLRDQERLILQSVKYCPPASREQTSDYWWPTPGWDAETAKARQGDGKPEEGELLTTGQVKQIKRGRPKGSLVSDAKRDEIIRQFWEAGAYRSYKAAASVLAGREGFELITAREIEMAIARERQRRRK